MAEGRPKKIALIGATGYDYGSSEARVECFPWNRITKVTNLADYDFVILDLFFVDASGPLDASAFRKMLDIYTAQQVLSKTESAIFVLGDPRFTIEWESDGDKHEEPFLGWTGLEFRWDGRPGTTVEWERSATSEPFKRFADNLTRWDYSLVACRPCPDEFVNMWDIEGLQGGDVEPTVLVDRMCTNSYGNGLVFSVAHAVEFFPDRNSQLLGSRRTHRLSNPIVFCPRAN